LGPFNSKEKVDYVDYANLLCKIIDNGDASRGVLICGTGVGMSIAANRFEKIRAALVHNLSTAPKCREHNNSNVLCLGSWTTAKQDNIEILNLWTNTEFGQGRHVKRIEKLSKTKENTIVFANGVFDILHTGHLELIKFSKSLGDYLVVAINSDSSVKKLKGDHRPINSQEDRKKILLSLVDVDEVVIFNEIDTKAIINKIGPSIIVKGSEWTADEVRERDEISKEIDVKIFPLVKNKSTTNTIKKIHNLQTWKKNDEK
jgi:D-beta-D-heptose 7-phosphate kinase/D-beta-D-heptose 1-phosphate adenosyltransferase